MTQNADSALDSQIVELASAIADQANAIGQKTLVGPRLAAAKRLLNNAETLLAWVEKDVHIDSSRA